MFKLRNPFARRSNNARAPPPRSINAVLRQLRGIVAAKSGARRWASRARKAINNRGRPAAPRPRNNTNNTVYVMYNGKIMTYNQMKRLKGNNRASNRQGGMWN
jgi:hypothetical protein